MKNIFTGVKTLAIISLFIFGISFAYAWVGPTAPPPEGNTPAPLNVGNSFQTKSGSLSVLQNLSTGLDFSAEGKIILGDLSNSWAFSPDKTGLRKLTITPWSYNIENDQSFVAGPIDKGITIDGNTGNLDVSGGIVAAGPIKIGSPTLTEGVSCLESQAGTIASLSFPNGLGQKIAFPVFCNGSTWKALDFTPTPPEIVLTPLANPVAVRQKVNINIRASGADGCLMSGTENGVAFSDRPVSPYQDIELMSPSAVTAWDLQIMQDSMDNENYTYTFVCTGAGGTSTKTLAMTVKGYHYTVTNDLGDGSGTGWPGESCATALTRIHNGLKTPVNKSDVYALGDGVGYVNMGYRCPYFKCVYYESYFVENQDGLRNSVSKEYVCSTEDRERGYGIGPVTGNQFPIYWVGAGWLDADSQSPVLAPFFFYLGQLSYLVAY